MAAYLNTVVLNNLDDFTIKHRRVLGQIRSTPNKEKL